MFEVLSEFGGSVLLLKKVPKAEVSRYGVAQVKATAKSDVVQVTDLVEKPSANEAPSDLAVMGRYVLNPAIFEILENTKPGRGGEIQLTDAIQVLAQGKGPDSAGLVHGLIYEGVRFDTGDLAGYLETVVQFAANRADVGPEFKAWLKNYVSTL
jgi:UTP--glucose-1-phosphate uridylyltransferase